MQQWSEDAPAPTPPAAPAGFCDGCGASLAAGTRFCTACGRPREGSCPWCNAPLPEGVRFCPSCGRPAVRDRVYQRKMIAGKPIAGFGFRAGVFLIDSLIMSTISSIAQGLILGSRSPEVAEGQAIETFSEFLDLIGPYLWWTSGAFVVGVVLQAVWNSIGWSPAMRVIGLRIVDAEGRAPGWKRGLGRTVGAWLSATALGLGYLAAAWHAEKRTWHDRMAGTWVVDVRTDR